MSSLDKRISELSPKKLARLMQKLNKTQEKEVVRPPIRAQERSDASLPLSFAQQRLWFLNELEPENTIYNLPAAVHLQGKLHVEALEQSLQEIVRRHESLRTTFASLQGQATQVIAPTSSVVLPIEDIQHLATEAQAERTYQVIVQEQQRAFDLEHGPLIRALLIRQGPEDHILVLTIHHIVSDGWSMGVLTRELAELYTAYSAGKPSPLKDLVLQYADYALWQRQWLQGEVLEQHMAYWKRQLGQNLLPLELPTDHPRPATQSYHGLHQPIEIPAALIEKLKIVGQQQGATLFMTLLSAFKILLYRYSQQEDIVIGTPIANRTQAEIEDLIGFFVNTLVLRTDLGGNPSFRELVKRVREVTLEAYTHQDIPFEHIVEMLQPERDLSRSPLFQVMFVLQNTPGQDFTLGDLKLAPMIVENDSTKFDLMLQLVETEQGVFGNFEYSTDLFDVATIERMVGHFQQLLESIAANPDQSIATLALITPPERQQLLGWNTIQTEYAPDLCLHQRFEQQVVAHGDAEAILFEEQRLTYTELNQRANQVAHYLRQQGIGAETLVGLSVERSPEMLIGILGILKAGGAYVPLDPAIPEDRLTFILADAQVAVILTQQHIQARFAQFEGEIICLDEQERFTPSSTENPPTEIKPESLAYVIYTSGSTGKPKGVLVTHNNIMRLFKATQHWYNFTADDVWTLFHSYAFDFSVWEIWGPLLYGGKLVVVPYWMSRSPQDLHAEMLRTGVTILNQTPSAFRLLQQTILASDRQEKLALRLIFFGGEALEFQSLGPWFERFGDQQPQLVNMYGITETSVHTTYRPVIRQDLKAGLISNIGCAFPDLCLLVLDQYKQPVPIGVIGELYVGGAGVARGYLRRDELTAERFMADPLNMQPEIMFYRSGDLVRYQQNGDLEYIGRIDTQVKIRGHRIELGEIESILIKHVSIQDCVVVAREIGAEQQRLVAYIVVSHEDLENATLQEYLQSYLPEYMVPALFVRMDSLPLTANGKVDRRALPAPDKNTLVDARRYVEPRTPVEKIIASIWEQVLGVERVGLNDNFFALGGDSILSIQIVALINQNSLHVTAKQLFQYQTVATLAAVAQVVEAGTVREAEQGRWLVAYPSHRSNSAFLSICQCNRIIGTRQYSCVCNRRSTPIY
ncbi:hypothetical protein KDW_43540 [Dictyobacter vulcani]|uniref:Carrier domain-containing protein n=1 Tax=Dictyobacter vulcani TaxID=2607529 RepID=A0A5J4KSS7_9CHLR|nr:non-ribosomal peptide synthetase [Dictyobacter vulcani]GER90192.1 hypothetical protein KDW_43540 [Dictyobacter vulcani]